MLCWIGSHATYDHRSFATSCSQVQNTLPDQSISADRSPPSFYVSLSLSMFRFDLLHHTTSAVKIQSVRRSKTVYRVHSRVRFYCCCWGLNRHPWPRNFTQSVENVQKHPAPKERTVYWAYFNTHVCDLYYPAPCYTFHTLRLCLVWKINKQ